MNAKERIDKVFALYEGETMVPEVCHFRAVVDEDTGEVYPDETISRLKRDRWAAPKGPLTYRRGYWSRLQMPGYLDATGWCGPFRSAALAAEYLLEVFPPSRWEDDDDEV